MLILNLFEVLDQSSFKNYEYFNFLNQDIYKKHENLKEYDEINIFKTQMFLSDSSIILQVFIWILLINFLGIIFIPVFYKLFINFPDFGYSFYKFFGLLSFTFIIWFFTSYKVMDFIFTDIFFIALLLIIISLFLFIKNKK